MKVNRRKRLTIGIVVVLVTLVTFRIYYVNKIEYTDTVLTQKNIGQTVNDESVNITVQSVDFYDRKRLKSNYKVGDEEDSHIIVTCRFSNKSDREQWMNLSKVTLEIGTESGGCMNPYVFQTLNGRCTSDLILSPGESRIVYMPYPMEKEEMKEKIYAVFSLYPEKIRISLN